MTAIVDMTVSKSRPRVRRVLLVISVVLCLTGFVATRTVASPPTPMAILDQARDFLKAHPTVRFTGATTTTSPDSSSAADTPATTSPDGLGSTSTSKSRSHGEINSAKHALHEVDDAGADGASEMVQLDKVSYSRFADTLDKLQSQKWAKYDLANLPQGVSVPATQPQDQSDLSGVLKFASSPQRVARDGNVTTISVDLDPVKLFGEAATKALKSMTAKLAVIDGGEVRSMQVHISGKDFVSETRVAFADWGAPVTIFAPSDDQVDPTPDTNEEAIAAWHDAPLYMPTAIPAGWALDYADVIGAADTAEGCAQVELDFEPPGGADDNNAPYMYIYELPTACADNTAGTSAQAFRAGSHSGVIDTGKDGISMAQLTIDAKTTIQAETTLTPAELATVLSRLGPLDLSVTPAAIAGIGAKQTNT